MAARYTEKRRERFLILDTEVSFPPPTHWSRRLTSAQSSKPDFKLSPGFANEKKVDHLAITLEVWSWSF
jgi:hypothetical protein